MRKSLTSITLAGMLLVSGSCINEEPDALAPLEELSEQARSFFGVRNGYSRSTQAAGNSMVNQSYRMNMKSLEASGISTPVTTQGDSSITIDPMPWVSCAVNTQVENDDGSITYLIDYGDGCLEGYGDYQYLMFGNYAYTWKQTESRKGSVITYDYFSRFRSDGYGGEYYYEKDTMKWISNGRSVYQGQSTYDTLKQTFTGNYTWSDSSDYQYDGATYHSRSMGKSSYDEKKSVMNYNTYEYRTGSEFYRSSVLRPLVSNNDCMSKISMVAKDSRMMWWPSWVSGRERIEYERDGKSGMFEIEYGEGDCDFIIHIYENGKVFRVDMGSDYSWFTRG